MPTHSAFTMSILFLFVAPEVTWLFNNTKVIKPSTYFQVHQTNDGQVSLEITKAFPEDAGQYTLRARNLAGTVDSTASLNVTGRL